jgi:cyclopropane fatty-acyl-phospholipid synthase-like methyltransferase
MMGGCRDANRDDSTYSGRSVLREDTSGYELFWTGDGDLALHHGYYDGVATNHSAALVRMNEVLAHFARISSGDRVLDAGSGYGGRALWLARKLGCSVIGVNLVAFQTPRARRLAAAKGVSSRARFLVADYVRTPFPDASFDVVWALESVVHAESQEMFVCEAARLLSNSRRHRLTN